MKLDRNIGGTGKYAIVNMRKVAAALGRPEDILAPLSKALRVLEEVDGVIEYGDLGSPEEFFVLKLKDRYARAALLAYAAEAATADLEYAAQISSLADRAGDHSLYCKDPD